MLKSDPGLYQKVFAGDILAADLVAPETAVVVARVVSFDHLEVPVHCTYSVYLDKCSNTLKPVLSDHIKQDKFLPFQTGGCLLLYKSSAESSSMSFLHSFHSVISSHLSIVISILPEWMVA